MHQKTYEGLKDQLFELYEQKERNFYEVMNKFETRWKKCQVNLHWKFQCNNGCNQA